MSIPNLTQGKTYPGLGPFLQTICSKEFTSFQETASPVGTHLCASSSFVLPQTIMSVKELQPFCLSGNMQSISLDNKVFL
jgi:hypothetical protein